MLQQLYPLPSLSRPLQGTYLELKLHQQAKAADIFIYANYISSLDGRISLLNQQTGQFSVPDSLGNQRDWRLYQELAGQCDVMITSARYFRQLAQGQAQDLLPVGRSPDFSDIQTWRQQQGLAAQPDVVVLSNSLNIPISALTSLKERNVLLLTSNTAPQHAIKRMQEANIQVIQAPKQVTGLFIRQTLIHLGYSSAYMIAGPQVHHTLQVDGCIDTLFLTSNMRLLGSSQFHTILEGNITACPMTLQSLYLDEIGKQMFMRLSMDNKQT